MSLHTTIALLREPTRREHLRRLFHDPSRRLQAHPLLTRASLLRARKSGRQRIYELAPSGANGCEQVRGASRSRAIREVALDAFKRYAEEELVTIRKYQVTKSLKREDIRDEALRFATISTGVQSHSAQKSSWHRVRNAAGRSQQGRPVHA